MRTLLISSCAALAAVVFSAMPLPASAQSEDTAEAPSAPAPETPAAAPETPAPETPAAAPETPAADPVSTEEQFSEESVGETEEKEEEEDDDHKGFFFRFTLGLGWAWLSGEGTMPPAKGLVAGTDPRHNSPAFNFTLDLGGGFEDLGLHLGVLYERMILRGGEPFEMGVTLMGIGGGATYYFTDNDFFFTAQVRLVGLLLFMPGVICDRYFTDKFEWYRGPGFSLTLGKEWFGGDEGGIGVALQGNYAYLMHASGFAFHYGSLLLVLTLTRF